MVPYSQIRASNALISDNTIPAVAVFVGGTSGVGSFTVKALVETGLSMRIYLIGRKSSAELSKAFIEELNMLNPKANIVWIEGEVSLLAETKRICEMIRAKERHVDLLFMSAGYAPFGERRETSEGIEVTQSLAYYTRMLLIFLLLPLLEKAEAPRVISVLAGGTESTSIDLDDIDLRKPGNFGLVKTHMQYKNMTSMAMDKLAEANPSVAFIHSCPGSVNTGNVWRGVDNPNTWMAWLVWLFLDPLIRLFSTSHEESGQRYLYQCTSAAFGGRGVSCNDNMGFNSFNMQENGLFLVGSKCDCTSNLRVMQTLRDRAQTIIWDHTVRILTPYL